MESRTQVISVLCLTLLAISILQLSVTHSQQGYDAIFVFYIPYGKTEILVNATSTMWNTSIMNLKLDLSSNPDFYLYWLITGEIPSSNNISLLNTQADQDRILLLWSNATLIDIPLVDPRSHSSCINPVMNISINHIPPAVLEVPINGSTYWDLLQTQVSVEINNTRLRVELTEYNATFETVNFEATRSLGPRLINITRPYSIAGEYYISLYIDEVNNETSTVKIFFPGSIKSSYYASTGLGNIQASTHWYLLEVYRNITKSISPIALEWWINNTINSTTQFINNAVINSKNSIYIVYIPHLLIARDLLSEQSFNQTQKYLFEQLVKSLTSTATYTWTNYLTIFLLIGGEEGYAVFAGKTLNVRGLVSIDYTMTQLVGVLLSYSNATPFNNSMLLALTVKTRLLENENSQLRSSIDDLNATLTSTRNELSQCESERELLRVKTLDIDATKKEAEELMNTAKLYIMSGLIAVIAFTTLMGFLAFRISVKKKHSTR